MVTIGDMIERLEAIDVTQLIGDAINETWQDAVLFNQDQLLHHLRMDGELLKKLRWQEYIREKTAMNSNFPSDHADARYTGALFHLMYARFDGLDTVTFGSTSDTADFMEERDSPAIFGLSEESIEQYRPIYMEAAVKKFRELTVGL